jgi:release factor glutamine methyltransferase
MKIGPALEQGRRVMSSQSETPSLDAQVLLADILGRDRAWVLAHPEAVLNEDQSRRYTASLRACREGQALPHVLGWWEFYGRRFRCTPEVLIPRPETELLVDHALETINVKGNNLRILDVGTGSGCVAVTLAAEASNVQVFATDVDQTALRVARDNAKRHDVQERIRLICADLLLGVLGPFNLICANLPYIPTDELAALRVGEREPRLALDGGQDGLGVLRRFIEMLPGKLDGGATVLMEIGDGQGEAVTAWIRARLESVRMKVHHDLAGRQRLLCMRYGGEV